MDDREAEQHERQRLMGQGELDRNNGEQRRNAKRDLEDSDRRLESACAIASSSRKCARPSNAEARS
jgi:hypothetical protein